MTEMTPTEAVFFAAAALPPADRAAYLDRTCAGNDDLRRQVERMLAARSEVGDFLEPPSPPAAGATAAYAPAPDPHRPADGATRTFGPCASDSPTASFSGRDEHVGAVVGGKYKLIEEIGEGGMGSVFMAQQTEPVKRAVAVKVIKAGMDSKAVLARFDAERQALAMMDHPNIAKVLDGGTTESGRPFFVMELVKGVPITQFCDERKFGVRERLELFVQVCNAIQHAHQKGIIHRDIKPSNVLIALYDDKPVPKVIDFGIAKAAGQSLTDHTLMTGFGAVVGTPEYMSPEQASLNNLDIDTRSDVYALGVLLYELLTGSTPVDRKSLGKAALLEILRIVREVEVPRPSAKLSTLDTLPSVAACRGIEPARLSRLMRGELDWVLLKALEKDRTRRYESANGFAADVQRYLAGEAVQAHPPSTAYRLKKFVRRNKGQVLAASVILFALLTGIAGTTWGLIEAKKQEQVARNETAEKEIARAAEADRVAERDQALAAEAERIRERDAAIHREAERADELKHRLGVSQIVLTNAALDQRDVALAAERLDLVPAEQRGWDWRYLKQQTVGGIFTLQENTGGPEGAVSGVAYSPDGSRIATSHPGAIKVWDARTGVLLFKVNGSGYCMFGPDGKQILRSGASKPTVLDAQTGKVLLELDDPKNSRAVFSPDGTRILTGNQFAVVQVWDARNGTLLFKLEDNTGRLSMGTLAYSPDGKQIIGCDGPTLKVWDALQGGNARFERNIRTDARFASFSPDGTRIILGRHNAAEIVDARDGTSVFTLKHSTNPLAVDFAGDYGVLSAAFSPCGTKIVTGGGFEQIAEVRVWNARTGTELLELMGHRAKVLSVAFSPDGTRIVTGSRDGAAKVWDAQMGTPRVEAKGIGNREICVAFSPDGTRFVTGSEENYWPERYRKRIPTPVSAWVFDSETGTPTLELKGQKGVINSVAFSPDGSRIVTGGWEGEYTNSVQHGHATVWDAKSGDVILKLKGLKSGVNSVAFSPDGKRIATGGTHDDSGSERGKDIEVKVWDAETGTMLIDLTSPPHKGVGSPENHRGGCVAFSPDGTRILIGGHLRQELNGLINRIATPKVVDARTGAFLFELKGHNSAIYSVAFNRDGTKIVVCEGRSATLWDVRADTPAKLIELKGHTDQVFNAGFSPDGKLVATGSGDGTVRVWDVRTGTTLVELKGNIGIIGSVAFSPDGTRILAGGRGRDGQTTRAIVWNLSPMPTAPREFIGHTDSVTTATFSPDGTRIVTGSNDRTARVWNVQTGECLFELKGHTEGITSVAYSVDGKQIVVQAGPNPSVGIPPAKANNGPADVKVWDAATGTELLGAVVPPTVPHSLISPDGSLRAQVGSNRASLISMKPNAEELAYRRIHTRPNVERYLDGYLAAKAVKDDFAVQFYLNLIPEKNRTALVARAEMDDLARRAARLPLPEAVPVVEELLKRKSEHLGRGHRETTDVMCRLAAAYRDLGRKDPSNRAKAVPLYVEAVELMKADPGLDAPETLNAMELLGGLYREMDQFDKAVPLFEQLLKIQTEKFGRTHPWTLESLTVLCECYRKVDRATDAIRRLEEAHRALTTNLTTVAELIAAQNMAKEIVTGYEQTGQQDKIVSFLLDWRAKAEGLKKQGGLWGAHQGKVLWYVRERLGVICLKQKRWAEAEKYIREHIKDVGDDETEIDTFYYMSMLGEALLGQKKYAEAEPLLLKGYEGLKKIEKTISPQNESPFPDALDRLIEFYTVTNKPDEVKKWRAERAKYPNVAPTPREKK